MKILFITISINIEGGCPQRRGQNVGCVLAVSLWFPFASLQVYLLLLLKYKPGNINTLAVGFAGITLYATGHKHQLPALFGHLVQLR